MKLLICFIMAFVGANAFALPEIRQQDIKLPTQLMLEHQKVSAPITAAATTVINAHTAVVGGETYATFAAQPDFPRNLTVTPGGTTANVLAGSVVISGLDLRGGAISETFAISATQSTATTGNKAFSKVLSVVFPAAGASTTWSVGIGTKLGLSHCMDFSPWFDTGKGLVDGAALTGATVAVNSTAISGNTVIPNPAPNGSRVFDFVFIQNFRCY